MLNYTIPVGQKPRVISRWSRRVLNLGAGFLPLVAGDIDAAIVYNYDPLTSAKELDRFLVGVFFGLILDPDSGIVYDTDETKIRQRVEDYSIDLLLAISPYGFSAVSGWVDRKIKFGGQVLIAGNRSNPWVTKDKKLFGKDIDEGVVYRPLQKMRGAWAQKVEDKIRKSYPSQTSSLEKSTHLDVFRRFVKGYL